MLAFLGYVVFDLAIKSADHELLPYCSYDYTETVCPETRNELKGLGLP